MPFSNEILSILQDKDDICAEYELTPELFKLAVFDWKLVPEDLSLIKANELSVREYLEFVRDHDAHLKDIPKVHVLADDQDKMVNVILESFAKHKCVRVSGVYHKTENGFEEKFSSLELFMRILKHKVIPRVTERVDVIYEGERDSRLPHPSMVLRILRKRFSLGEFCRFVTPGCIEPVASTRIMRNGAMTTFFKGSIVNNFHFFEKPLNLKTLGCQCFPAGVQDIELSTAEMVIHFIKAYAASMFPIFRRANISDEKALESVDAVVKATTCKNQKKAGRLVPIDFDVYGPTASYIAPFLAAAVFAARIAQGDQNLLLVVRLAMEVGNTYVESSVLRDTEVFTGDLPDYTWGETVGSPQIVTRPDGLVDLNDPKIQGIFGKGFALLQAIMREDKDVLESIPFHGLGVLGNYHRLAAKLFDAIWIVIEKNVEKLEAKKGAGGSAGV